MPVHRNLPVPVAPLRVPATVAGATSSEATPSEGSVALKIGAAVVLVAMIGTAAYLSLMHDGSGDMPRAAPLSEPVTLAAVPIETSAIPVVVQTSPSVAATLSTSVSPINPPAQQVPLPPPVTSTPSPSRTTVATSPWKAGSVVSLAERDRNAFRVRHRDFIGRADRINANSSALDHADSRFTVRNTATAGCYSLESVNYPGYFLRHRNFVIHLDKSDSSSLFGLDATFCPVAAGNDSYVLRSTNYPDRYVTDNGDDLILAKVSPAQATAFVVVTPF